MANEVKLMDGKPVMELSLKQLDEKLQEASDKLIRYELLVSQLKAEKANLELVKSNL